ncbi:Protein N-acetyltransferase, RimJ/RimL family [Duganella sacchari]|uniref:Protein N-acetyltransferase, RimJ/RimL family n=1 Tax=Duganella sacchari TaxID=551987 RepID=A0A1M7IXI4_9BURK|nr:GNAT family N-acetyltransferase [Duganella sacchari]SHM45419.1 Protein N-acetyltransferase, RimJ/RimL family [Duganella sacchari]
MSQLRAHGFLLRPFVETDAATFAAAVRESTETLAVWMPWARSDYTEQDALDWFAFCAAGQASGSAYEFGVFRQDDLRFVGGAGLNHFNSVHGFCNLGYWIRSSAYRQGAATAAVAALARHAFDTLQLSRVEIVVAEGNEASMGVARKSGATYECLARNRVRLSQGPVAAHIFSLIP